MLLEIKNITENPTNLMRSLGYIFQHQDGNEMSFIRPMARAGYPRFHIYTKLNDLNLIINLHLDQKKETYGQNNRHHGEYADEGALQTEANRIKKSLG